MLRVGLVEKEVRIYEGCTEHHLPVTSSSATHDRTFTSGYYGPLTMVNASYNNEPQSDDKMKCFTCVERMVRYCD
ncbi:hypothetical protein TNCV_2654281 [Trichonephila clavipes]|nr:hypothetical protein TNCV_2654281 [Trichonephila clavipes]